MILYTLHSLILIFGKRGGVLDIFYRLEVGGDEMLMERGGAVGRERNRTLPPPETMTLSFFMSSRVFRSPVWSGAAAWRP